jgi:NADH dehydrogenase/putative oxidoreductase
MKAAVRNPRAHIRARMWLAVARNAAGAMAAIIDLGARLWLAQAFFVSGLLKISNWDNALYLSAHEYPVSWLDPVLAAYLGAAIELICPIFLAVGLMTRLASLPMLALSLVIQFGYQALDANLYWAALFGWFVVLGPGPLSLDRRLGAGLRSAAVPFAAKAIRLAEMLRQWVGPVYQLAVRLWLAFAVAGFEFSAFVPMLAVGSLARIVAPLLAIGLAAPVVCLLTMFVGSVEMAMGGAGSPYALWLLALLCSAGAGPLSADVFLLRALAGRLGRGAEDADMAAWPHVVIVGGGFGGLACAIGLRLLPVRITLIDRRNHHLFQPLLYQVATASLSPGDIATPIRGVFRDDPNVTVLRATLSGVDPKARTIFADGMVIRYDYLVLATGATHAYFGKDQWAPFAPGLKRVEDALAIRARVLDAFERAEAAENAEARSRLLTFVIVGGGPTGVEMAGALAELARHGLDKEFRRFDPADARIILVQSAPRILPTFPERLSTLAKQSLEVLGVEVRLNSRVDVIDGDGVTVAGTPIASGTVFWAAGVMASPAAIWLNAEADGAGRVKVAADLSVPGLPNVFAVGDTAASSAWNGNPVPGLAPAAKQGGEYVAGVIRARVLGDPAPPPFRYRHAGSLATIGRKSAVADFGRVQLSGAVAWWLWGLVHVYFLVGLRNRLSVMFDWFWAYLTYGVGVRLITGEETATQRGVHTAQFRRAS